MSTETATDIAALVGEMEALPCEHSQHGQKHGFEGQRATHYIHSSCNCGLDDVFAGCIGVVEAIKSDAPTRCAKCGLIAPASHYSTILGPVNK